ncbi:hypothetical protein GALMADRAFT_252852 [Galerina marginata CBS 339.88]|uniref:DUF6533 domain-containing protein n=1 Tax=Galerina marginata (strain CBS 339.88) TaxID=685588 RepID=A0A067SYA3_GALM3|nr:hypothetical protein GALMADRAFT_252852 [Galerina marginata CBS 339.88]
MGNDSLLTPETITLGHDLLAFKRYYVGMAALLAYDYCLTIGKEVQEIWRGGRSPIFYLYVVNRYCPMAFCIITLSAYFSSLWTAEVCNRFAIVKWFQTLLIVIPAESVLVMRTFALTNRNRFWVAFLGSIMIVQCCVVIYAMSRPGKNHALATPVDLADPYHVCILFSDPRMDTAYLGVSILFDFTVFSLTILRTINFRMKQFPRTALLKTILKDGVMYFSVILSGNVVWMICALTGRRGIKLINAQPSLILTSIMITRLTLSLRNAGHRDCTALPFGWSQEILNSDSDTNVDSEEDERPTLTLTDNITYDMKSHGSPSQVTA